MLERLCREVRGARGAIFVDYQGERVQQYVLDPGLEPHDLSVAGAYVTPLLAHPTAPQTLHVIGNEGCTFIQHITELYAVVLLASRQTVPALARHRVAQAAKEIALLM